MTRPLLAKVLTDFADEFGLARPDTASLEVREQAFLDAFNAFFARDDAGFDEAMAKYRGESARRAGRAPTGQALAVPATPANAVDGPSGFDPSRERPILEWGGLRVGRNSEHCYIRLGDARALAEKRYLAKPEWGAPLAASCFVDVESGAMRLFVADYANGKRLSARHSRGTFTITYGKTPPDELAELLAIATEARRAGTGNTDPVHEGAGRDSGIAPKAAQ